MISIVISAAESLHAAMSEAVVPVVQLIQLVLHLVSPHVSDTGYHSGVPYALYKSRRLRFRRAAAFALLIFIPKRILRCPVY